MKEYIIYKGGIPFVRFSKGDAETAVARHGFTWNPPKRREVKVEQPSTAEQSVANEEIASGVGLIVEWDPRPTSNAIDINNASLEELESLKGVGIAIAQAVVSERPHTSVEGLASVSGRVDWNELYREEFIYFGEPSS